ncbi:MAG: glycine-rich domain-containing protein [Polynucleobacter sp.]
MAIIIKGGAAGSASISGSTSGIQVTDTTGAFTVPAGTNAERPATPTVGMIRYNTSGTGLEQYDGTSWIPVGSGTATPASVSDQQNTSTGYFDLPSGTTAQRPNSPTAGMVRFNTSVGEPEWYNAVSSQWLGFSMGPNYVVEYLAIGGGGGGGYDAGGGGGAGGLLNASVIVAPTTVHTITIGAGGARSIGNQAGAGGNTVITGFITGTLTAIGGGYGGDGYYGSGSPTGGNGGSGGGGCGDVPGNVLFYGGYGTPGQGYGGGWGFHSPGYNVGGGGGGGASGVGENEPGSPPTYNPQRAGNGGNGLDFSTWAAATYTGAGGYYAGGGGGGINGGGNVGAPGIGGLGGGGDGAREWSLVLPEAGIANTGGGGGGGYHAYGNGAAGGSGIVIIRYPGLQRGVGGTITQSGGYTYHTFLTSGTFTA